MEINYDNETWDSGLRMWICHKCDIGIQEKKLNQKPEKCPLCGNKNLMLRGDAVR